MSSVVETLETKLFPIFERLAQQLNEMPDVSAKVYSYPAGGLTDYQGHAIGISCLLLKPRTEADNVALAVELAHLTSSPRISADVSWGDPSGRFEAVWGDTPESVELTNQALESLYVSLPTLCESLIAAVKNGRPSSDKS